MVRQDLTDRGNLRALDLDIPPLPDTLPRVLNLIHGAEDTNPDDVADVVHEDPSATARLLKQVNSAYYGLRRSVSDVHRAVRMIGPRTVAGTVLSASMSEIEDLVDGPAGPCFKSLMCHSESTALYAQYLRGLLGGSSGGTKASARCASTGKEGSEPSLGPGFTEGLLHDIGKIVLTYNYPRKAVVLYQEQRLSGYLGGTDELELERLVFGCDHTEAGAFAAMEMDFPPSLLEVIRHHHEFDSVEVNETLRRTLRAVSAASLATRALGAPFSGAHPYNVEISWNECAEHDIWGHWAPGPDEQKEVLRRLQSKQDEVTRLSSSLIGDAD